MENITNHKIIAEAMNNSSGIVSVVDKKAGNFYTVDFNKIIMFDLNEIENFTKVFVYDQLSPEIMRSKLVGLLSLNGFKNNQIINYSNKYKNTHIFENILDSENFTSIVDMVLIKNLFLFEDKDNSMYVNYLKKQYNQYKNDLLNNIAVNLLQQKEMLSSAHPFYQLSVEIKSDIVEMAIKTSDLKLEESNLSKVSKVLGVRNASKIVENKKNPKFLNEVLKNNLYYSENLYEQTNDTKPENVFNDFINFFKYDMITMEKEIVEQHLRVRNIKVLQMFCNYYPDHFRDYFTIEKYVDFVAGVNENNYKELMNFIEKNSNFDIWSKDGVCIKSLYHQQKLIVIENIISENPINIEEYYKLENFMQNRSFKDCDKLKDYDHFMKIIAPVLREYELNKAIPKIENNLSKAVKF